MPPSFIPVNIVLKPHIEDFKMPTEIKYGKMYMKDASGNIVQIMPKTASIIPDYQGATASANGIRGLVPAAQASQKDKFLRGDGTWQEIAVNNDSPYIVTNTDPETDQSGEFANYSGVIYYLQD